MNPRRNLGTAETQQEDVRNAGSRLTPALQEAVCDELEMMLGSALFAQSNRCKGFLNYVVRETLAGRAGQLKERTIGVHVFDRALDYDTGDDSIVRVTANDVRKRISQYYQESQAAHRIQIDLPRGSYVPEFHLPLKKRGGKADERKRADGSGHIADALPDPSAPLPGSAPVSAPAFAGEPENQPDAHQTVASPPVPFFSRRSIRITAAFVLAASVLAATGLWRSRARASAPKLWEAFSHSSLPILICLGEHNIQEADASSAAAGPTIADVNIHSQMIPVDDASVIAALANQLGKRGIPFRLAGADQVSFTEFQRQPVILIGALDNKWTLRLTQGLRYRISVVFPSVPGGQPVASIVDVNKPGSSPWMVDFAAPLSDWRKDYAIVARVDDTTSGVPVLIEAGLGSAGSVAASQLLTSGALASSLKIDPHCAAKTSFEAVLETGLIDGKPGPPHILSLDCW